MKTISNRFLIELYSLSECVSRFSEVMRKKLFFKAQEGFKRWDDTTDSEVLENLREHLKESVAKYADGKEPNQLPDIANFAAFLWHHEEEIAKKEHGR